MKPIPSSLAKAYEQSRANLRSSLENASSDEINLNSQTLSADLMKSSDSEIITKLSKFVYSCFKQIGCLSRHKKVPIKRFSFTVPRNSNTFT